MHIDPALDPVVPIFRMAAYLVKNGVIPKPEFDEATILTSFISLLYKKTFLALHLLGCTPTVTRSIPLPTHWVGVTGDGERVEFGKASLGARPAIAQEARKNTAIKDEALRRHVLYCDNDSTFHEDGRSFEALPGIPAFTLLKGNENGAKGSLVFNVKTDFRFYPFRLPSVHGVRWGTKESPHGGYVTVEAGEIEGPLSLLTIRRVSTLLYAIAEQIAEAKQTRS